MQNLKKILYLEDDTDMQLVMALSLEDIGGYTLKTCSSADEVLVEVKGFNPDLFLLDIMLPDTNGFELLAKIRKINEFKETPAIFISTNPLIEGLSDNLAEDVIGIISKPFDPIDIAGQIKSLWNNYWQNKEVK